MFPIDDTCTWKPAVSKIFYSPYLKFLPVHRINRGSDWDPRVGPVALGVLGVRIPRSLLYRALGARSLVWGGHIMGVSWWPSKKNKNMHVLLGKSPNLMCGFYILHNSTSLHNVELKVN